MRMSDARFDLREILDTIYTLQILRLAAFNMTKTYFLIKYPLILIVFPSGIAKATSISGIGMKQLVALEHYLYRDPCINAVIFK